MSANILVVEDEADIMLTIRLTLQAEGYEVIGVTNGEAAMAIFEDSAPDVTVLDVALPGIDGLEVVRRLREDPRNQTARIIIASAHASGHARKRADALGCGYLTKPFSTVELNAAIAAVLALRVERVDALPQQLGSSRLPTQSGVHAMMAERTAMTSRVTDVGMLDRSQGIRSSP